MAPLGEVFDPRVRPVQPILQRRMAPIRAGALIGAAWGLWHLPAFFLAGVVFADWNFLPFFIGNVTLAILVTPIFNSARGSLLLPMLFHWQLINPFWPDAQPWDTWILVGVAAVIVWWKRDSLFTRVGAVTEVVPTATTRRPSNLARLICSATGADSSYHSVWIW